ncbi:MAG: hypothetical protein ACLP50_07690 [Solirubrobacteraceae bacterium]
MPIALSPITTLLSGVASSVAGDVVTVVAQAIVGSLLKLVADMSTFWVSAVPSPSVGDVTTGAATGTSATLQQDLLPIVSLVVVGSIIVGGVKIAIAEQKYEQGRHVMAYLVRFVIWSTVGAGLCAILVGVSDSIAGYFVSQASTAAGSFGDQISRMLGLTTTAVGGGGGVLVGLAGTTATAFLAILLGLVGLVGSLIEIVYMFIRSILLILLVGTLPLAAAMSDSEMGRNWLKKSIAWIIAFACYKPVAAIVYVAAFSLGAQGSVIGLVQGFTALLMAVLALPAMMRFLVPLSASLTAGGSSAASYIAGVGGVLYANSGQGGPTGAADVSSTGTAAKSAGTGPTGADTNAGPSGGRDGPGGSQPPPAGGGGGGSADTAGTAARGGVESAAGPVGGVHESARTAVTGAVQSAAGEPGATGGSGQDGSGRAGARGSDGRPGAGASSPSGHPGPSGAPGGGAGGGLAAGGAAAAAV